VGSLAIDPTTPTTLYAGTGGGVFKSTNGGGNWSAANAGLPGGAVGTLAIDPTTPTTLYAGTISGGVFKSTNGGGNWSAANTGLPAKTYVSAVAIDPTTPTTLYAGTAGGVFKSTDGGGNWSAANTGLVRNIPGLPPTIPGLLALAIDPTTPTTLYAGTEFGVFKSTDGGDNWSAASTGLAPTIPDLPPNYPAPPTGIRALVIDPTTPTTLYAGTMTTFNGRILSSGVFKSTNGGGNWSAANTGLPANTYVSALAIDSTTPTTLYAGTFYAGTLYVGTGLYIGGTGGVFKSTDGGGSWSAANSGLTSTPVAVLVVDPNSVPYAGTYSGGVFAFQVTAAPTGTPFTISNLGGVSLTSSDPSGTTETGYAAIRPDAGQTVPSGLAIFGFRQNGVLVTEAGVPASPLIESGRIYAAIGGPVNTGVAIANPNGRAATITFFFTDTDGNNFGEAAPSYQPMGRLHNS
jgi:hypothetical protein